MVERRKSGPLDPLELAREKAGSSAQLVIDLYDRHKSQFPEIEYEGQCVTPEFEVLMMSEIREFLKGNRDLFFSTICHNLITHVEASQKGKREGRVAATIVAFSHYSLLCRWVEQVAQELHPPLTRNEQSAITAFQKIVSRLP